MTKKYHSYPYTKCQGGVTQLFLQQHVEKTNLILLFSLVKVSRTLKPLVSAIQPVTGMEEFLTITREIHPSGNATFLQLKSHDIYLINLVTSNQLLMC